MLYINGDIKSRFKNFLEVSKQNNDPNLSLYQDVVQYLAIQSYQAKILANQVNILTKSFSLTSSELALALVNLAACYANPEISNFYVGAVIEDLDGNFYFGANLELENCTMQHTIHAEQSAIQNALANRAKGIKNIAVNYSPCGHCRQFINEVNTAETLNIYLPNIPQGKPLSYFLPNAFGPNDLNISQRLFDGVQDIDPALPLNPVKLVDAEALLDKYPSYSPYSNSSISAACVVGEEAYIATYIENAAFNPSLSATMGSINQVVLSGYELSDITDILLYENENTMIIEQSIVAAISKQSE